MTRFLQPFTILLQSGVCRGPHKLRVSANNLKVKLWLSSQTRIVRWNWMWMSQEKPPTNVAFANCFFFSSQKARSKKLQVWGDYFDIALWFLIDLAQWGCPACCLPTCRALLTCWPLFCSVQFLNRACFSSVFCSYVWHVPAYCLCSIPWYGRLIPSVVFLKVVVLCSALSLEVTCACLFSVPMSAKPLHVDPMIQGSLRRTGMGIVWPALKSFQNLVSPVWLANWFLGFQTARTRLKTVGRTLLAVTWNAVLWCWCLFKAFPY